MFNKIEAVGGFVLYVGVKKTAPPALHNPDRLYTNVLLEAVKRIDQFCEVTATRQPISFWRLTNTISGQR